MSRRTQFFLVGAAGALAAAAIATGVAAQSRSDDPDVIIAEARAKAEAARDAAMAARDVAEEARDRARAEVDRARADVDREVRIERDGKVVMIHRGHGDPAAMEKEHREHLKAILQLRPNQEAALDAYLASMKPKAEPEKTPASAEARPKTTPERLARMEQRLAEREGAQRARIDATRRFYNQLDAAQKRAFDELPLMMGPMEFDGPMHMVRYMRHDGDGPHMMFRTFDEPVPPVPPTPPTPPRPPKPPAI